MKNFLVFIKGCIFTYVIWYFFMPHLFASGNTFQPGSSGVLLPSLSLSFNSSQKPGELVNVLRTVVMMTVLTLAPTILIMTTSFTRMVVVLGFLRQAIGTPQTPPNQLIVGLAIFLTFFVMAPTIQDITKNVIEPYLDNKIEPKVAFDRLESGIRSFMLNQVREKDLSLFVSFLKGKKPQSKDEVPTTALVPAFITSELKTAFQIGFTIYLPFLVLDLVVASTLMAMGMMMLPPSVIAMPIKLLLFVMVDGWELIMGTLVKSFS